MRHIDVPVPEKEHLSTPDIDINVHFKDGLHAEFVNYEQQLITEGFETHMRTLSSQRSPMLDAKKDDGVSIVITAFGPDFPPAGEPMPEPEVRERLAAAVREQREHADAGARRASQGSVSVPTDPGADHPAS